MDQRTLRPDWLDAIAHANRALESKLEAKPGVDAEALYKGESAFYEVESWHEHLRSMRAENKRTEDDIALRKTYASKAFWLAASGVIFWCAIFATVAIVNIVKGRPVLSDAALITLTTGATVNVIAAFLGVIRGLFPAAAPRVRAKPLPVAPKRSTPRRKAKKTEPAAG
jgi:hypothetical protein